jgi:peptidoglycan/xylan/chitin deacetylase (PgdA/CDA1 family)
MLFTITSFITLLSLALAAVTTAVVGALSVASGNQLLVLFGTEFVLVEGILLYGILERRAPIFGRVFWRGPKRLHAISLTFDDGPNEPYTSQILDILAEFEVKATFFVLGENAEKFPETLRREVGDGHEIGNHTFNHHVLPLRSGRHIRHEIARTSDLIEKATGVRPKFFRAPHGWRNPWVNRAARKEGCIPVAWTLGVWDTDRPGKEKIVQRTLKGLRNGCVLLLHDGRGNESTADSSQLVEALPIIISEARRAGYRFLTISEMMKEAEAR